MSGFAGLADEPPDDEWDAAWAAYTSGAETAAEAPLRGRGLLPAGVVEVRGDALGFENSLPRFSSQGDGDAVADMVVNLKAPSESSGKFEWSVSHRRSGITRSGRDGSASGLVESLAEFSIDADDVSIYLDAALIDDGTQGVAIVGLAETDIELSKLLAETPWRVLTNRVTAVRHGTRTVWGIDLLAASAAGADSGTGNTAGTGTTAKLIVEPSTIDHIVWVADGSPEEDSASLESTLIRGELGQRAEQARRTEATARVGAIATELVENTDRTVVSPEKLCGALSDIAVSKSNKSNALRDSLDESVISELRDNAVLIGSTLDSIDQRGTDAADLPTAVEFLVRDSKIHQIEAALHDAQFVTSTALVSSHAIKSGSFIELTNRDSSHGLTIRLFTTVGGGPFAELVDLDDFHDMAAPVRFGDVWLKGVDPAHRFIGACLRFDHDRTGRDARDSAVLNVPRTRGEVERVSLFAERCGATSSVRNVTTALMRTFPSSARDLLEELAN